MDETARDEQSCDKAVLVVAPRHSRTPERILGDVAVPEGGPVTIELTTNTALFASTVEHLCARVAGAGAVQVVHGSGPLRRQLAQHLRRSGLAVQVVVPGYEFAHAPTHATGSE